MARTTGKRQWKPEVSGVALRKLREAAGLEKRVVAFRLGVNVRTINAWEDGIEPPQRFMARLDTMYGGPNGLDEADWMTLYVPTDAEVERQQDREQRRATLTQQVASLEGDDLPVRF